jgi:hypothetical protein
MPQLKDKPPAKNVRRKRSQHVSHWLENIESRIENEQGKVSVTEYIRLAEFEKELEQEFDQSGTDRRGAGWVERAKTLDSDR